MIVETKNHRVEFGYKSDPTLGDESNRFMGIINKAEYDLETPEKALGNLQSRLRWNTIAQVISYGSSLLLIGFGSTLIANGFVELVEGAKLTSGYLQVGGGFVEASGGVALSGALGHLCREHREKLNLLKQSFTALIDQHCSLENTALALRQPQPT